MSAHQGYIYSNGSNTVKYDYDLKELFSVLIYFKMSITMAKLNFQKLLL